MLVIQHDILSVIPQRPPFVMVDDLIDINDTGIYTSFLITDDNVLIDDGKLTEAGLMENMAQTAAAGAGYAAQKNGDAVPVGYIGAVKNLEIFSLPAIGDVINTRVTIIINVFEVTIIAGEIMCGDNLIAKCEMKIFTNNKHITL